MISTDYLRNVLRQAGLRLTPQRIAICQKLFGSEQHPTAQMIYDQVKQEQPSISLATVYSVLESLADLGLVSVLGTVGDGTVHYDGMSKPHLHLNCTSCHNIFDIDSPSLAALKREVQQTTGFELLGNRIVYYGLCPDCQETHQIPII